MVGVIGQVFVIVFFPCAALLADRYGSIKIMMWGFALSLISAPLLYALPATHSFWLIALGQMVYAIPDALFGAPIFKFMNDLFPARVRYSAISFSYNIGIALFAGTAPMIAAMLQNRLHAEMAPAFYIMLASTVALISLRSQLKWRRSSPLELARSA
jgi:MHS family proline/betaine transporter-like MFS transporter